MRGNIATSDADPTQAAAIHACANRRYFQLLPSEHPVTGKIISLQWLRFVSATMVVMYHGCAYLQIMKDSTYGSFVPGWFGTVGVALFFALSGNLMASLMKKTDAIKFLLHRIVRIYPTYYIMVVLMFASSFITPIKPPIDWHALSLFPYGGSSYPLGVEWTLVFEVAFYMFVFLLIFFRKTESASSFLIGWLALILLHNVLRPDDPTVNVYPPLTLPFVTVNVGFAMGMLLPIVFGERTIHPILAAVIATSLFYAGFSQGIMPGRWGLGIGAAIFVHSLSQYRPKWEQSWFGVIGDKLGAYSYAIYLCHVPIIRTIYALWENRPEMLFWTATSVSVLIALFIGEMDIHVYRHGKAIVDKSSPRIRQIVVTIFSLTFFYAAYCGILLKGKF